MTKTHHFLKTMAVLTVTAFIAMPHVAAARDNNGGRHNNGPNVVTSNTITNNKQNAFQRVDAMRNAHTNNDRHDNDRRGNGNYNGNYNGNHNGWNNNWNNQYRQRNVVYYPQPYPYYGNRAPRVTHYYYPHQNVYIGKRVVYRQAPPVQVVRYLEPAPYGYYYSMYNNDVFLVRQQDNVIEQVISLLFGQ